MNPATKTGLIIGRFQPFHNEHLAYALAAKKKCDFLWIGLSKFIQDSTQETASGDHRHRPEANPLNYCERFLLISEAMVEAGLSRDDFGIVPCPIDTPERIPDIIPLDTTCYLTVNEPWGEKKVSSLREVGYEVVVLWEREKKIASTGIREAIENNNPGWKDLVPPSVARNLESWRFRQRLQNLATEKSP